MNNSDRTILTDIAEKLGRIDEKASNIYTLTEKQERHLSKLNDSVAKNTLEIAVMKEKLTLGGTFVALLKNLPNIIKFW